MLEQDAAVGGTLARCYDRLHLHTIRQFSGLAHFPIPSRSPKYLSRDQLVEYLARRVPLIDGGLVAALRRGALAVKPAVERLKPNGVSFADATSEAFDAIVAATGFTSGLESLLDVAARSTITVNCSAPWASRR